MATHREAFVQSLGLGEGQGPAPPSPAPEASRSSSDASPASHHLHEGSLSLIAHTPARTPSPRDLPGLSPSLLFSPQLPSGCLCCLLPESSHRPTPMQGGTHVDGGVSLGEGQRPSWGLPGLSAGPSLAELTRSRGSVWLGTGLSRQLDASSSSLLGGAARLAPPAPCTPHI